MKAILYLLLLLVPATQLVAQAPQSIPYQAAVRNSSGKALTNQSVKVRFSIRDSIANGAVVYQETQAATANAQGLVNVNIGQGAASQGSFAGINWGANNKFIQTEIDIAGGSNFTDFGTTQFMSVPYALYAASAGNAATGTLPTVQTNAIANVNYTNVQVEGNLVNNGGRVVLVKGICYSTQPHPTEANAELAAGIQTGSFSAVLNNLAAATLYYVRAFATTSAGTAYGEEKSFTTLAYTIATVSTEAASNVSNLSVQANGTISFNGGSSITDRGFVWATTNNPTLSNSKLALGSGEGVFTANLTGLSPLTTYYVRAYATNAQGTVYGSSQLFTTTTTALATVATNAASSITYTTATCSGQVLTIGGDSVTQRGICYGTSTSPTVANSKLTSGSGLGTFSLNLSSLLPGTTYYVRAYATNKGGTAYGSQVSFTTLAYSAPSISTTAIFSINTTTAAGGGNVTSDGGNNITQRGICWSTQPSPTLQNGFTADGTGAGSFNSNLTGLTLSTKYYVRAYATNSLGTTYGAEVNFTTSATVPSTTSLPVVGTSQISKSTVDYSSGGYISTDGGAAITQQGICWNTLGNPTLTDSVKYFTPAGVGYYALNFNLPYTCQQTYYVRAFAKNSNGIVYASNQTSTTTGLNATVATVSITNIGSNGATISGNIGANGGCSVTERGICYGISGMPTTAGQKVIAGTGNGAFSGNITNLAASNTYYVRAYAVTVMGTFYGEQQQFTTSVSSTLGIGQKYAGGFIFYLDATGRHGLVCDTTDLGDISLYTNSAPWGCQGTLLNVKDSARGKGAQNTAAIVAGCSEANTAAKLCDDLVRNGYSDWYLPSLGELSLMYTNLKLNGLGELSGFNYWSSTELNSDSVYQIWFGEGTLITVSKKAEWWIRTRAVRSF